MLHLYQGIQGARHTLENNEQPFKSKQIKPSDVIVYSTVTNFIDNVNIMVDQRAQVHRETLAPLCVSPIFNMKINLTT